jgi:hypothetical protein
MATKWTQRRIAKAVKNPGTRANVPTNLLPSSYRQQRLMNARLNAPVTEGSSLTNRQAAQERNAQVDLKYGQAERQIQSTTKAIPQWYQQYRDLLGAAQQGVQQGYQQAAQQFQTLQAGTTAQQGQNELAAYQQQAQQLGQVADPNAAAVQSNAAAIRGANAGSLGSVMAAQGANSNAYGQNLVANTGRHQIEQLLQEVQKGTDLSKEKGAYAQQVGSDIYDRERKQVLENQAFGLQTAKAQADVQNVAADNARASSLSPRRTILNRVSFVRKYATDHNYSLATVPQRRQFVASLRRDHPGFFDNGGNETMLSAALDLAAKGRIQTGTLQNLRKQGVYIAADGSYWAGGNR